MEEGFTSEESIFLAEIMEKYTNHFKDNWYETPSNVTSIVLNPTTGKIAEDNEYSKNVYFNVNNIPWYIFESNNNEIEEIIKKTLNKSKSLFIYYKLSEGFFPKRFNVSTT